MKDYDGIALQDAELDVLEEQLRQQGYGEDGWLTEGVEGLWG